MATLDHAILSRQVELLYRNTALGQAISLFNGTLLALLWRESVGITTTLAWWLIMASVAGARVVLARRYRHQAAESQSATPWLKALLLGAATSGLVWAFGGWLFMAGDDDLRLFFTAFLIAGMTAGAVPFLGAHRVAFRVYAWPIILTTLFCGLGTDMLHLSFSLMAAAFLFGVTRSADHFHDAFQETLRLEQEKDRLLTDLTTAKVRAEASAHAKARFLASISHELRTPMNGIMGMADLLAGENLSPEQRELLLPLRESADELLGKIENMIELSELEVGQIQLHEAAFSLAELLPAILGDLERRAIAKGLRFSMDAAPDLPEIVVGDLGKLRKILLHVVDNAVKFTPQGEVQVTVHRETEGGRTSSLVIVVRDSGPGIPLAEQGHLFEIFTPGNSEGTHRHGGTGIGLPIAHRLCEAMGGTLRLESASGHGTTVRLQLPFLFPDAL